jgi:hypothetical protein
VPRGSQNATDPHDSYGGGGGGGGADAFWVGIILVVVGLVGLATILHYRYLVRVANEAEMRRVRVEKSGATKRDAAAAVRKAAVSLDDMDLSAHAHDLYAKAECAICLAGFEADDGPVVLPCAPTGRGHAFHDACLQTWWAARLDGDAQITCPICRKDFSPVSQDRDLPSPPEDLEAGDLPPPRDLEAGRPPPAIELRPVNHLDTFPVEAAPRPANDLEAQRPS